MHTCLNTLQYGHSGMIIFNYDWVNQWVIHPRLLQLILAHIRWWWLYGLPLPSHTFCLSWLSPAHSHNQESRGGIFSLKNYLTRREFRSGKADWDDQNLSGPSGTLKINTCRLRTSWAPKLHDHLHFLNFRFHCPPLSQLDLIHLLFVLHGCTQHHQIVASTHIFVSELNKSINDTHPHREIFHTKQMCHEFDLLCKLKNVWEPAECSWHLSTSRNPFWPSHLLVLTLNLLSLLLPQLLLLPQFNCCCSFSTSTIWPQVTRIHTPSH